MGGLLKSPGPVNLDDSLDVINKKKDPFFDAAHERKLALIHDRRLKRIARAARRKAREEKAAARRARLLQGPSNFLPGLHGPTLGPPRDPEKILHEKLLGDLAANQTSNRFTPSPVTPVEDDRISKRFKMIEKETATVMDLTGELESSLTSAFSTVAGSVDDTTGALKRLGAEIVTLTARKAFIEPLTNKLAAGLNQIITSGLSRGQVVANNNREFLRGTP